MKGSVLDVGCGTGENALHFASLGHEVWGIDASERAIAKARAKTRKRRLKAHFLVHDALELARLGRPFDTVLDSGLFHVFSDEDRPRYARSLAAALRPGGAYHMLCFSEKEPTDWGGPRRVTAAEIRSTFRSGWRVDSIEEARFATRLHDDGGYAWLASITRL